MPTAACGTTGSGGSVNAVKAFLGDAEDNVIRKASLLDETVFDHGVQEVLDNVFRMVKPLGMKPLGQFGRGQIFRLRNVQQAEPQGGKPSPGVGRTVDGNLKGVVVGAVGHCLESFEI